MPHFVNDNGTIATKTDARGLEEGVLASQAFDASSYGVLRQACYDLRDVQLAGLVHGLAPQASRPSVVGAEKFFWLRDTGALNWFDGESDTNLLLGGGGHEIRSDAGAFVPRAGLYFGPSMSVVDNEVDDQTEVDIGEVIYGGRAIEVDGAGAVYDDSRLGLVLRNTTPGVLGNDQTAPMLMFEASANSTGTPTTMAWGWVQTVWGQDNPQDTWLELYGRNADGTWTFAPIARFAFTSGSTSNNFLYVTGDLGGNTGSYGACVFVYGAGSAASPCYSIQNAAGSASMGGLYRISDTAMGVAVAGAERGRWTTSGLQLTGDALFDTTSRSVASRTTYASNVFTQFVGLIGGSPSNYISFSTSTNYLFITAGKTLEIDSTKLTFNGPAQVGGHITSGTGSTYDLGGASDRWATVYVGTVDATAVSIAGALTATSVVSSGAITGTVTDTNTATIVNVSTIKHLLSSGTAAAGIGTAQLYQTQNASGTTVSAGQIAAALKVATAGSEQSYFRWQALDGTGALADALYAWAGRVGIGTSTTQPSAALHVITASSAAAALPVAIFDKTNTSVASNYLVKFSLSTVEKANIQLDASDRLVINFGTSVGKSLLFTAGGQISLTGSAGTFAGNADLSKAFCGEFFGTGASNSGGIYVPTSGNIVSINARLTSSNTSDSMQADFDRTGLVIDQRAAIASPTDPRALRIIVKGHTALTASTEFQLCDFGGSGSWIWQWATGALTTQRFNLFRAPTVRFVGASTLTNAATVAIVGAPVADTNATLTNTFSLWVQSGTICLDARILQNQGADVASGSTITLDEVGNFYSVTGATTIDYITTTRFRAGTVIRLKFASNPTVTHNAGSAPANTAALKLAGATNFSATADDVLTLVYDGTNWVEAARSVN